MRIDDENKVVWCSEEEMSWFTTFNLSKGNDTFLNLRRINALSTEKEVWLPNRMSITDRIEIIRAISDNYIFKLKQPKKYYWRKKKEHLAWFEKIEDQFLKYSEISGPFLSFKNERHLHKSKLTEQKARDILKDDFDKFEKVEE